MFHHRSISLLPVLAVLAVASSAAPADWRRPKKLIETGWDMPDSDRLPNLLAEMERRPFDGAVIQVLGRKEPQGKPFPMGWAFQNEKWDAAWFQPAIERIKACKFHRLTDNFAMLNANPGNVDWFDDAGWANIVEHWRIAAKVAKQAGLKGILFDPEPYAQPHSQFHYAAQPQRDRHTFAEYYAKARQRGREVIEAAAREYPDMTLLCFFMNSVCATAAGHRDPRQALAGQGYGLYPAMIDGWLDAAPQAMTFVDGCESAYRYNSRVEFLEAGHLMRGGCQELVSPENRGKYRAQVQVGFGIYLDAHWNPKGSPWYIEPKGGSRAERLRANVADALSVADQYVWIYGEKFRWWPSGHGRVKAETWPEALPGCEQALRYARDPLDYARPEIARLRASSKLVNLARNGDFGSSTVAAPGVPEEKYREGGTPAGWHAWQEDKSKGTFIWDRQTGSQKGPLGAARIAGVSGGCLIQDYRVKPGERYAVAAIQRVAGKGQAAIRIRWQTEEGRWTAEALDVVIFPDAEASPNAWTPMLGVAQVPEGAGRLVVLLGVSGQPTPQDVTWYDDVEVYRLE